VEQQDLPENPCRSCNLILLNAPRADLRTSWRNRSVSCEVDAWVSLPRLQLLITMVSVSQTAMQLKGENGGRRTVRRWNEGALLLKVGSTWSRLSTGRSACIPATSIRLLHDFTIHGKCQASQSQHNPPHAYGPGALLGAWACPAPTPNKPLAGHLVAILPPEPPPPLPHLFNFELN
jgi:hypothetical protein